VPPVDRGEIFAQITFRSVTPLTTNHPSGAQVSSATVRDLPDIDADTAVSRWLYASPFGGFLVQGNIGQVHVWLKTSGNTTRTTG